MKEYIDIFFPSKSEVKAISCSPMWYYFLTKFPELLTELSYALQSSSLLVLEVEYLVYYRMDGQLATSVLHW